MLVLWSSSLGGAEGSSLPPCRAPAASRTPSLLVGACAADAFVRVGAAVVFSRVRPAPSKPPSRRGRAGSNAGAGALPCQRHGRRRVRPPSFTAVTASRRIFYSNPVTLTTGQRPWTRNGESFVRGREFHPKIHWTVTDSGDCERSSCRHEKTCRHLEKARLFSRQEATRKSTRTREALDRITNGQEATSDHSSAEWSKVVRPVSALNENNKIVDCLVQVLQISCKSSKSPKRQHLSLGRRRCVGTPHAGWGA
jgi:hypothetical protein